MNIILLLKMRIKEGRIRLKPRLRGEWGPVLRGFHSDVEILEKHTTDAFQELAIFLY